MIQIQVLNKILDTKDYSIIADNLLDETYFGDYKDEFNFINDHYNHYKNVPDKETFLARFDDFDIIDVKESKEFLVDKLKEEHLYNTVMPSLQKVSDLIEKGDTNKAVEYLNGQLKNLPMGSKIGGIDIVQQATARYEDYKDRIENQGNWYFSSGFPELDTITHGIQRGEELMIIFARTNSGKCLVCGTKILMADGTLKNVEDVKVGDKVQSLGRINNVVALHNGVSNGFKIIPKVGESFVVSSQHILTLKCLKEHYVKEGRMMVTRGDYEMVDVQIEDFLNWSYHKKRLARLYRPAIEYDAKEQSIPPYILGSWLGDGTSTTPELTNIDEEIIDEWRNYAIAEGCYLHKVHNRPSYRISSYTNKNVVLNKFRDLKLIKNKHIPLNYLTGSREQRLELLAGIIDTDGCYRSNIHSYEIDFKSRELIEQTAQLCRGLGFKLGKIQTRHNKTYDRDYYRFTFSGKLSDIPVRVARKKSEFSTAKQEEVLTGFKVEPVERVEYYGFQTDGDNRFLLWDNTLTHNTWVLEKMCVSVWEQGYNIGFISPEMTATSVGYRFDTMLRNFSNKALTWGEAIDENAYEKYLKELEKSKNKFIVASPLDFDNRITISKLRTWIKQNDLHLLAIDGLTYISDERGNNRDNKTTTLTNISEDLMSLSVEMKIPILAVVQANRGGVAEDGQSGTPELETIRDSDGMAMNASKVLSLRQKDGILEIGIKKQRNGAVGASVKYAWDIDRGQFVWIPANTDGLDPAIVEDKKTEIDELYADDIDDVF